MWTVTNSKFISVHISKKKIYYELLAGLEPATFSLQVSGSTIWAKEANLVAGVRFELTLFSLWDWAGTISSLPHDIVAPTGLEPVHLPWKGNHLTS